jgi:hypothetical protein
VISAVYQSDQRSGSRCAKTGTENTFKRRNRNVRDSLSWLGFEFVQRYRRCGIPFTIGGMTIPQQLFYRPADSLLESRKTSF